MIDPTARLDLVEELYLKMPDPSGVRLHAYLAARRAKKGCSCGKGKHCAHGRPRLVAPNGEPYSLRAVQLWLRIVKQRLAERLAADREENRALAVARFDAAFAMAQEQGEVRDVIQAAARRAELDGSHLAAEEAQRPRLYDRVRALMVTVEDYEAPVLAPETPPAPVPREVARHQLARLERLLLQADEGAARYRALGEPPADEAQRLTWRRNVLDETIVQTVTSPTVAPEKKRDLIVKAAGTAAMITEGADLAERVTRLEKQARGGAT